MHAGFGVGRAQDKNGGGRGAVFQRSLAGFRSFSGSFASRKDYSCLNDRSTMGIFGPAKANEPVMITPMREGRRRRRKILQDRVSVHTASWHTGTLAPVVNSDRMSTPRDHHFIPVFYLKEWAGPNGKLIQYSRPHPRKFAIKPVGPRATGFETDLYGFPDLPNELAQFLESKFLARTDELAALVHNKLLDGTAAPWTSETRSAWSRFAINFLIRHPHPFAEIRSVAYDCWLKPDSITQTEYERIKQPEDPPTFEEWVLAQGDHLADRIRIRLIQGVMDNEPAGEKFNAMLWSVLDLSKSKFHLLTSDWPLYREINGKEKLFALPISPTALFTAVTRAATFEKMRRDKPDDVVRHINAGVVSAARLYVYASDGSQERFVRNRMSTRMSGTPFFPSLANSHGQKP